MTKAQRSTIQKVTTFIQKKFIREGSGHDWYHIYRVHRVAQYIGVQERANMFVTELAALLHDIADAKFYRGDHTVGPRRAKKLLQSFGVDEETTKQVIYIVGNISFEKTGRKKNVCTLEGKVVQDADRLDAIGAIGIARVFTFGGFIRRPIFNPAVVPTKNMTTAQASKAWSSIHHFYEKLLHVKKLMNTKTGRHLARQRHEFIEKFLRQFFKEWGGKI